MKTFLTTIFLAAGMGAVVAVPVQTKTSADKQAQLYLERSEWLSEYDWNELEGTIYGPGGVPDGYASFDDHLKETFGWTNRMGGVSRMTNFWHDEQFNYWGIDAIEIGQAGSVYQWPATTWPELSNGSGWYSWTNACEENCSDGGYYEFPTLPPPQFVNEISDVMETEDYTKYTRFWPDGSGAEHGGDAKYHRRYQQEWRLRTGGRSGSQRKSLFRLSATAEAWRLLKQAEFGTLYELGSTTNLGPINPVTTEINIGALGRVGSDSNLWIALADNTTNIVTPIVGGVHFYTFTVDAQKHVLQIFANSVLLDDDKVNISAEVCVGQKVSLAANWDEAPQGGAETTYEWIPGGDCVNSVIPPITEEGSEYLTIDFDLWTNNPAPVWWYGGGIENVWCRTTNRFANGQEIELRTLGKLPVFQPTVEFVAGSPAFVLLTNGYVELGDENYAFGNMTFGCKVTSKEDFHGTANWTQLIHRFVSGSTAPDTDGHFWLDSGRFYNDGVGQSPPPTIVDPVKTILFSDAPGVGIADDLFVADHFKTYLVFKPGPSEGGQSIWVTLGIVTWDWWALAQNGSLSDSNVTQATYSSDNEFPTWLHIYSP